MIFKPFIYIPGQIVPYKLLPTWMKNRNRYVVKRFSYLGRRSLDRIFPRFKRREVHPERTS